MYTAPASTTTTIKTIVLANTTASDARATLHLVPSAGSATTSNQILGAVTVSANTTTTIDTAIVIPTGASIYALASTTSAINIHISGIEIV
jgi:hypothetical protein